MKIKLTLTCLLAAMAAFGMSQERLVDVEGKVFLPDGKPAPQAELSTTWFTKPGSPMQWSPNQPLTCDENGHFKGALKTYEPSLKVVVMDRSHRMAAVAELGKDPAMSSVTFKLQPMVLTKFSVLIEGLPNVKLD